MKKYEVLINTNPSKPNEYTEYSHNLQLPFSIIEKADDAYDAGVITLRKMNRKEPFAVESKVIINIYQNDSLIDTYSMQVEEDDVQDIYIGPRKYYNHNISIIELTKKLDRLYLPDFTITNPATKTILKSFEQRISNWNRDVKTITYSKTRTVAGEVDYLPGNVNVNTFNYTMKTELVTQPQYNKSNLSNSFAYSHVNGTKIELPIVYAESKLKLNQYSSFQLKVTNSTSNESSFDIENINTALYYYYKSDKDSAFKQLGYINIVSDTGAISSHQVTDSTRFSVDTTAKKAYFKIGVNGDEKVELKIEVRPILRTPVSRDAAVYDTLSYFVTGSFWDDFSYSLSQFMESFADILEGYQTYANSITSGSVNFSNELDDLREYTADLHGIANEGYGNVDANLSYIRSQILRPMAYSLPEILSKFNHNMTNVNYNSPDKSFRNTPTYTAIDTSITPLAEIHTAEYQSFEDLSGDVTLLVGKTDYKTIRDVLEKINTLLSDDDKFIIDSSIDGLLSKSVPEKIYNKRNVAEILFELGTLISAYPYLTANNVLTFKSVNPDDNSTYIDKDTAENVKYNSENATNAYITNITNMINIPDSVKSIYSYWPSDSAYAYSNGKWENLSVSPDTNQIQISNSNGLYYLKYIKIKNCLNNIYDTEGNLIADSNTVIDLTNFCPEKTYYDTLYVKGQDVNSNTSKTNCIYWTKGSNIINIDALEATEKATIWGEEQPEQYRIQNAILIAARLQISPAILVENIKTDTTQYKFQVCYIDYMNGLIKNKKFNQESLNEIISNYNQTDNNISGEDWLNTSQINILRRGNTELSKTVFIKDLNELPKLGEIKYNEYNEKYLADSISYTFDNNIVSVNLNYTKHYNKIDPSVTISKDYRQYEIYGKEVVTRDVNIDRYLYLDFTKKSNTFTNHGYKFTAPYRENGRIKKPNYAVVFFKDKNKSLIKYHNMISDGTVVEQTSKGIIIPLNYSASGNNITFQCSLMDNYSGGYYPDLNDSIGYYDIFGKWKTSGAKRLKEARYVDDLGEAEYASFYIIKNEHNLVSDIFPLTNISEEFIINNNIYMDYEKDIPIKKDNREKINFIYQIHYLTHEKNLKWNPAICKYLFYDQKDINEPFLDSGGNFSNSNLPTYYGLINNMSNEALLPIKVNESGIIVEDNTKVNKIGRATVTTTSISGPSVTSIVPSLTGYALVYPKTHEVIFHVDKKILKNESIFNETIYFNFYKNRV